MDLDTTNKIPFDIHNREKLKDILALPFEPTTGLHIEKRGSKTSSIVKFHPPQTRLGIEVSDHCLENLVENNIISEKTNEEKDKIIQ